MSSPHEIARSARDSAGTPGSRAVRRRLAVAVLAGSAAVLTGCGTDLAPDVHPGSAAVVGDERIALDTVDDFADGICEWQQGRQGGPAQKFPMAFLRAVSVEHLVQSELLDQYADEHGLEPDALSEAFQTSAGGVESLREYQALVETEVKGSGTEGNAAKAAIDLFIAGARNDAVALAAGLADDPSLEDEAAVARGQELIDAFREEQEIDIDPRFGQPAAESLAYEPPKDALSVLAEEKPAETTYFEEDYLESLPPSQRCG